jgi:hypothetical protein
MPHDPWSVPREGKPDAGAGRGVADQPGHPDAASAQDGQDTVKFAYADPPYLCGAHLYKEHPEWRVYASIDGHADLIARLVTEYPDGWALSMSSVDISAMAAILPTDVRWGAWIKPFASFKPNVTRAYCWEPVAFMGGRKIPKTEPTVRDFIEAEESPALKESITLKKGMTGAKPRKFCEWLLDLMAFDPRQDDEFDDLFPGSGVFGAVRDERIVQTRIQDGEHLQWRLVP